MLNTIFTRSGIIARLEQNPLGAYLEELATSTLIGLLASTGLRAGEALRLQITDL